MSPSDVLASLALAISLVSTAVAVLSYRGGVVAERRQRMPALVFRRDDSAGSRLLIANVGAGPAMNVVYAQCQGGEGGQVTLAEGVHEVWFNPIHMRPIQPGEEVGMGWEIDGAGLGLRYTDAFGATYVAKAGDHAMRIFEGTAHLPGWDLADMPYLWHVEASGLVASGPLWGECAPGQAAEIAFFGDGADRARRQ